MKQLKKAIKKPFKKIMELVDDICKRGDAQIKKI